jgi:hypothetical protein
MSSFFSSVFGFRFLGPAIFIFERPPPLPRHTYGLLCVPVVSCACVSVCVFLYVAFGPPLPEQTKQTHAPRSVCVRKGRYCSVRVRVSVGCCRSHQQPPPSPNETSPTPKTQNI